MKIQFAILSIAKKMVSKNRFIDPKKSVKFQVVHRSQRDPRIADEEASKYVLRPIPVSANHKDQFQQSMVSFEDDQIASDYQGDSCVEEEASLYGIFFNDQETYDYMQHLRPIGQDPSSKFIPAQQPVCKQKKNQSLQLVDTVDEVVKMGSVAIPSDVLPSATEEDIGLLNRAAPSTALLLDESEHVREALYALEDDAYVEDDLDDSFFDALNAEELPEEFDSEDECVSDGEEDWMKEFKRFQKTGRAAQSMQNDQSESEDSFGSDKTPIASRRSLTGGLDAKTMTSCYSMSSSSLFRNDKLTLLDDRFERMLEEEYSDDDIGELDGEDPDTQGVIDFAHRVAGNNEDSEVDGRLSKMFDDFLNSTQVVGRGKRVIASKKNLDALRNYSEQEVMDIKHKYFYESTGKEEQEREVEPARPEKRQDSWDVESVLSTYSNIYNHPTLIREISSKAPKIHLKGKLKMPVLLEEKEESDGSCTEEEQSGAEG